MVKQIPIAVFIVALFLTPCFAQYREYHVTGKVVDKDQRPIQGVEIRIRDENSSRSYATKTSANGEFEIVGIPHGVYSATIKKDGYLAKTDQWKFEQPQERIQKATVPTVVLYTQGQVTEVKVNKDLQAGIAAATEKIRAADFDGALSVLAPLLQKRPDDPNLLYLQGICLLKKGSVQPAADIFHKVLAANPSFAPAHLQLGICYQQSNDFEKALESYKKVLELEPGNLPAAYNAGIVLYSQNKPQEALPYLEKAVSLKQDDGDMFETLAYCQLQLGNTAKSLESFERALAVTKDPAKRPELEEAIQKLKEQGGQ